jgi:hypothetical protein
LGTRSFSVILSNAVKPGISLSPVKHSNAVKMGTRPLRIYSNTVKTGTRPSHGTCSNSVKRIADFVPKHTIMLLRG